MTPTNTSTGTTAPTTRREQGDSSAGPKTDISSSMPGSGGEIVMKDRNGAYKVDVPLSLPPLIDEEEGEEQEEDDGDENEEGDGEDVDSIDEAVVTRRGPGGTATSEVEAHGQHAKRSKSLVWGPTPGCLVLTYCESRDRSKHDGPKSSKWKID